MTALANLTERLAVALGGGAAAQLAASALIEAEALGMPNFGLTMLNEWKRSDAPLPVIDREQAVNFLDCSNCFSPVSVAAATLAVSETAQRFGLAAIFLRGVKGFGRLAPFVRHVADAGLLGIAGAEGPPFVAPYGGTRPVIGTNPIALGFGSGSDRIVIDVASSLATMADVRTARAAGTPVREGIALDRDGKPTTLATDVAALLPRGGQIGSLIGLIVELMAGVAGGGRNDAKGRGVFLLALDPARAGNDVDWQGKLAALHKDWTIGGGHWPRGGDTPTDVDLDVVERLDAHLARMQADDPDLHRAAVSKSDEKP